MDQKTKKHLKTKAHHLKPIILLGDKGLTDAVQQEIQRALYDHELIKIKIAGDDRDARTEIATQICDYHQAELIQSIGKTIIIFKKSDKVTKKEAK